MTDQTDHPSTRDSDVLHPNVRVHLGHEIVRHTVAQCYQQLAERARVRCQP
jgi:hypothetical protein